MQTRLMVLTLIVPVTLGACGTPAGLERSMEKFAKAATQSEQALMDLDETASQRLTAIHTRRAVEGENADGEPVLIRPLTGADCGFEAPGCELRLMTQAEYENQQQGEQGAGTELRISSVIPNQLALAREIALYATGLEQIAAADKTEAVRQGVEQAMASICGLAGTLGNIIGAGAPLSPACEAFRVPVTSVVAFIYGEYQAQAKLSALRDATAEMQPLLERAADLFSVSAKFATDGDVRRLTKAYDEALGNWESSRTKSNLNALLDASANLDAALNIRYEFRSDESVFRAFALAHKEIRGALSRGDFNLSTAIEEIERLGEKAAELADLAEAFKDAVEKAQELDHQS